MEDNKINGYTVSKFKVKEVVNGKASDGTPYVRFIIIQAGGSNSGLKLNEETGELELGDSFTSELNHFVFEGSEEFSSVIAQRDAIKTAIKEEKFVIPGARISINTPTDLPYKWKDSKGNWVTDKEGNIRQSRRITQFVHVNRLQTGIEALVLEQFSRRIKAGTVEYIVEDSKGSDNNAVNGVKDENIF